MLNIQTGKKIFFVIICIALGAGWGAYAATTDNGCGNENNDRITAELALCTTHAYNIGRTQNPTTDAERQFMREVVALKTTVMTQQMYKQYEYLDATMRRLKTQLEKAILTTKLQAAGASTTDGSAKSAASSSSRNVILSGAYDCIAENDPLSAMNCLQRNLPLISSAISSGNMGDAKRQLEKDLAAFNIWKTGVNKTELDGFLGSCCKDTTKDNDTSCSPNITASRNSLENCVNTFRAAIAKVISAVNNPKKENK